jgi:hypothetical protein
MSITIEVNETPRVPRVPMTREYSDYEGSVTIGGVR